jgi:hypothetical protein
MAECGEDPLAPNDDDDDVAVVDDAKPLCDAPERTKLVMERELSTRTITRAKNPDGTNGNA